MTNGSLAVSVCMFMVCVCVYVPVYYKSFLWNGNLCNTDVNRPYISFTLWRKGIQAEHCVSFDYETSYYQPYAEIIIMSDNEKKRVKRYTAWKAPPMSRGWRSAAIALPVKRRDIVALEIRIVLRSKLSLREYTNIANLTVIPCSRGQYMSCCL